jgi:hypothetical protein
MRGVVLVAQVPDEVHGQFGAGEGHFGAGKFAEDGFLQEAGYHDAELPLYAFAGHPLVEVELMASW